MMKSQWKYSLNLCVVLTAMLLASCGKKENKINSSGIAGSSPFYAGNPILSSNPQIVNQVQSIKANVPCMNGYRLTNDVSFFVQGGYIPNGSKTKIGGNFQPGFMSNGTISKLFVGASAYRDLMFVTQVSNGASQVIGYNVTMSFCELKNSYPGLPSIISNERQLTRFQAPYGIILDSDVSCGYGVVDFAQYTTIVSEMSISNPYSPPAVQIPTSFSKPSCNGQL